MSYDLDDAMVDNNIKLTNEKIRLEADRDKWKKAYTELEARFNALQEMHWKLQDRHMALQATLVSEVGLRNARDYGEHPL
jgi:hypothetical protein